MNALFFDGHAIIHPSDLHPLDSREIFIGDFLSKERTHDVIMMWERKDFQAILILEAQSSVDFTMASRTLLYDALVYNMQGPRIHTVGIRYADVKLSEPTEQTISAPESFVGKVQRLEFRGDMLRAHVLLNDFKTTVTADVVRVEHPWLREGALLVVRLPEARWCRW